MAQTFIGLDLGQAQDFTAAAVIEPYVWERAREGGHWRLPSVPNVLEAGAAADPPPIALRGLKRYQLGTPYHDIVADVGRLRGGLPDPALAIDKTGVGGAVFELFERAGLAPVGVTIHGGDTVTRDGATYRVPKRELVSATQVLLQTGRLKVAADLPLWPQLKGELLNFKVKIDPKTAHDSYAAWREHDHDDLVLALALAAWYQRRLAARPRAIPSSSEFVW